MIPLRRGELESEDQKATDGGRIRSDRLGEQVDWLAYHSVRGEVWQKAVAYCRQLLFDKM